MGFRGGSGAWGAGPGVVLLLALLLLALCPRAAPEPGGEAVPEGASTLAFVFDVTGSMYDDLVQVIEGASKILETSLKRPKRPLYNFALVPFHDPGRAFSREGPAGRGDRERGAGRGGRGAEGQAAGEPGGSCSGLVVTDGWFPALPGHRGLSVSVRWEPCSHTGLSLP